MSKVDHPMNETMRREVLRSILILDGEPGDPETPQAVRTILDFVKIQFRVGDHRTFSTRRLAP